MDTQAKQKMTKILKLQLWTDKQKKMRNIACEIVDTKTKRKMKILLLKLDAQVNQDKDIDHEHVCTQAKYIDPEIRERQGQKDEDITSGIVDTREKNVEAIEPEHVDTEAKEVKGIDPEDGNT